MSVKTDFVLFSIPAKSFSDISGNRVNRADKLFSGSVLRQVIPSYNNSQRII